MATKKTASKKAAGRVAPKASAPRAKAAASAPAKAAKTKVSAPVVASKPAPKAVSPQLKPEIVREAAKPVVETVKTVEHTIEKGTETMNKQTNKAFDNAQAATDQVQAIFGDVNERAKTQLEKSTRVAEEMTEFSKGNVEAIVAASKIAAKGVESIGQDVAEFGRKSFEDASATLRSFAEVKSPTDFFRLQGEFARSQFDSMIAESSKMSEAMIKLAGEVVEPLTSRYSVAAERVKSIAA